MTTGRRPGLRSAARAAFLFASLVVAIGTASPVRAQAPDPEAVRRGEYIFNAAGCLGCHTDEKNKGPRLAGGREIKSPFGSFYGPNITPHPAYGIGRWTEAQFRRALREGIRPDGAHYFPAFPYTSFAGMTDADVSDLWAYMRTVPAVAQPNKPHDVGFPFNIRLLMVAWKALFFAPGGTVKLDPAAPPEIQRGGYLVRALGHCQECHSERNFLGGIESGKELAGGVIGGGRAPNLTPDRDTGLGKWSPADLVDLLKSGMTPDGDFVGSEMAEVVRNSTSKLTDGDVRAIVAYLRSLPPVRNAVRKPPPTN
jgi:mono/diheme cytochrome c family protein